MMLSLPSRADHVGSFLRPQDPPVTAKPGALETADQMSHQIAKPKLVVDVANRVGS